MAKIDKFPHEVTDWFEIELGDRIEITSVESGDLQVFNVTSIVGGLIAGATTSAYVDAFDSGKTTIRILSREKKYKVGDKITWEEAKKLPLYSVVCNITLSDREKITNLEYWIRTIRTYVGLLNLTAAHSRYEDPPYSRLDRSDWGMAVSDFNWDEFIFIDTETGGLDFRKHPLLEVTYAVGLEKPITIYPNDLWAVMRDCDPAALKVNHFIERFTSEDEVGEWVDVPPEFTTRGEWPFEQAWLNLPTYNEAEWNTFLRVLEGKTWVGANPSFDVEFIGQYIYPEPLKHHYHLFDIRSWWAGKLGVSVRDPAVKGFQDVATTKADHTSLNDVRSMRQAFALRVAYPDTSFFYVKDQTGIFDPESENY